MALLMGDSFDRNLGKPYKTKIPEVDRGYDFDIVVGGKNANIFEYFFNKFIYYTLVVLSYRLSR